MDTIKVGTGTLIFTCMKDSCVLRVVLLQCGMCDIHKSSTQMLSRQNDEFSLSGWPQLRKWLPKIEYGQAHGTFS